MAVKLFYHGDHPTNAAAEDGPIRGAPQRQQRLELDVTVGTPLGKKPAQRTLGNRPSLLREPIMGNIRVLPGLQDLDGSCAAAGRVSCWRCADYHRRVGPRIVHEGVRSGFWVTGAAL